MSCRLVSDTDHLRGAIRHGVFFVLEQKKKSGQHAATVEQQCEASQR